MDLSFVRRLVAFVYTLILLLFIGLGFCYTNELNDDLRENTLSFSDYWKANGRIVSLPYSNDGMVELENTLPTVYGDQILVLRVYYESFEITIDDNVVFENSDHYLFGHKSYVGNKEIWIPLDYSFSGKDIKIKIDLQDSIYGTQLTDAFLTTRSAYGIDQMKRNVPSMIIFIFFTVTGILEICIAGFYILKRTVLIRKLSFEALFYAGCFSIISAQWVINEARIPFIIFGHMTGFSILNIIAFLLMPMMFFEIARSLYFRIGKVDNIVDGIIALSILIGCILPIFGVYDWGNLVYLAHFLDVIVMIMVGYYSYSSVKEEKKHSAVTGIAIANCVFIFLAGLALARYINNVESNYILIILIDLMVYVMVQVGYIYRRIGLNVREEKEFAEAKVYAFTDELTKLGNRHHFYNVVEDYEKHKLPKDLTVIEIDVNRLKYYNDNMGHEAGDELLVGTAECIKRAFANSSTSTVGRLGGDEFGIIIVASELEVNKRLTNLRHYLSKWHGKYVEAISVAIGVASIREDRELNIEALTKIADERMYKDKQQFYESTGFDRRTSH